MPVFKRDALAQLLIPGVILLMGVLGALIVSWLIRGN